MRTTLPAAAALLALLAAPGASAQQVRLRVAADDEVVEAVRAGSLVIGELTEARREGEALPRRDVVAAAQADYRRIVGTLFERGYYAPVVSILVDGTEAADLPVVGGDAPVREIVITLQQGPRFLFGRTAIGPLAPGTELPEGFAPGAVAETDVLRAAVAAGLDAWEARGHALAELERQDLVADVETQRLDAQLVLAPGPRLSYGPVAVSGAARVREDRIRRIADIRSGSVYDPAELEAAAARLRRTGAFRSVAIVEAEAAGPGDTLPLDIQVAEQLPRRIGAGAELSTTEGLSFAAFWLHRNLTGRADSLRVEGEVAGVGGDAGDPDYAVALSYNRPATFNPETDLYVAAEVSREDEPGFRARSVELEVGAQRIVSDRFRYSYGLGYRFSDVDDAFGERVFQVVSVPLEAQLDERDEPLDATGGYFLLAEARPFYGVEGTDGGLRVAADARAYRGLDVGAFEDRVVAAGRLQLGSVIGPALSDVPPDFLFFSGGGGTVRGQEFQSLGSETLPSGRVVGGRSFLGLSAELRVGVTERIGVVGFADFGLVGADSSFGDAEDHAGAGLGARYDTGLGPIRLDVAVPVGGEDASGFELYLGIGQAF